MTHRMGRGTGSLASRLALVAIVTAVFAYANLARAAEPGEVVNACGCRKDSAGLCYCDRKAKCGCPGECEPKGCEEKRAKQLEKEIELETKKAEAAGRQGKTDEAGEDRAAPAGRKQAAEVTPKKHPAHQMTVAERRSLRHLLDLYVAEHPEASQKSIEEARAALGGADARGPADR